MHIIGISTITLMLEAPVSLKAQWLMWTTGDGHHFVYPQVFRLQLHLPSAATPTVARR